MSDIETRSDDQAEKLGAAAAFTRADLACPFGPSFFLGHLGRFVRDHCPDPKENLPSVQVRLADGETLDLCHIIGVSPRWVMLAVRDAAGHQDGMAIELVPFEIIRSVRIRTRYAERGSVGFAQSRAPAIIAAETLLQAVMSPAPHGGGGPGASLPKDAAQEDGHD
jgi:hypothetical protein